MVVGILFVKGDPCRDNPCNQFINGTEIQIELDMCIRIDGFNFECDRCIGVQCENGYCVDGVCDCDDGYVNINNSCIQNCDLEPCEDQ